MKGKCLKGRFQSDISGTHTRFLSCPPICRHGARALSGTKWWWDAIKQHSPKVNHLLHQCLGAAAGAHQTAVCSNVHNQMIKWNQRLLAPNKPIWFRSTAPHLLISCASKDSQTSHITGWLISSRSKPDQLWECLNAGQRWGIYFLQYLTVMKWFSMFWSGLRRDGRLSVTLFFTPPILLLKVRS